MSDVDGSWRCTVEAPIGAQDFTLSVATAGPGFTGRVEGGMGALDIADGEVDGQTLKWAMRVPKPMPMTLNCEATVDGDRLAGTVSAGIFGSFPLTGVRG